MNVKSSLACCFRLELLTQTRQRLSSLRAFFQRNVRTLLNLALRGDFVVMELRSVRKQAFDGEIHVLLPESMFDETEGTEDFDIAELKKSTKKEASKPLLLSRS